MKKRFKSLLLAGASGLMVFTLASCGGETRNTSVPYGENNKYNSDTVLATATNDVTNETMKMTQKQFYSRLRYSANNTVTHNIKKAIYNKEYKAVLEVLTHPSLSDVSNETKELLTLSKDGNALYSLTETTLDYTGTLNNYEFIRRNLVTSVSSSLSTSIFSASSAKKVDEIEAKDIEKYYTKYIETQARRGVTITKADLAYTQPTDDTDVIVFTNFTSIVTNYTTLVENYILNQAEKLAAKNALYQIADEEYIHEYSASEDDDKTKNSSFYLFKDERLESLYDTTYKTYGEYKAVIIQFNSRREALKNVEAVTQSLGYSLNEADTDDKVNAYYLALYNLTYAYDPAASLDDERFTYTVSKDKNDLSDLNDNVKTVITDTLENKEYFSEPRNLSNKYYMVYHINTSYDVSNTDEETKYDNLTEAEKAKYTTLLKWDSIESNATSYETTEYKARVYKNLNDDNKDNDLRIYDPVFEYRYYNSYSDVYTLINKDNFNSNLIFSYDGINYTVDDFYKDASLFYATEIFTNYFQLEYAYSYYDEFITSDTADSNKSTLETEISNFNNNSNASFPSSLGETNYLLLAYGYETKDDVLKYYYNAQSCLSSYKAKKVFEEWAVLNETKTEAEGSNVYDINQEYTTKGILYNLLTTGNKDYSTLFNINIDHILINIDANGDGTPDDPDKFLKDLDDTTKANFENAVSELSKALYKEATSGLYGDNSYYTILTHLKTAYEEGQALKTDPTKTWDDYKSFGFLLTVEQLASSGDITQNSVNNFVKPFKDYVKAVYKTLSENDTKIDDDGNFYIYDQATEEGSVLKDATDADKITINSLCKTVYGYHLLIVNSYSGPAGTDYKKPSDYESKYENNLPITLISDDTTTDEDESIVVYTDSWNEEANEIAFNQFFIYYVQKANSATSSLESNIASLCGTLFDDAISKYTGSNFQTYLLLSKLNIQIDGTNGPKVYTYDSNKALDVEYYKNTVIDYGEEEEYTSWVDGTYNWDRPKSSK